MSCSVHFLCFLVMPAAAKLNCATKFAWRLGESATAISVQTGGSKESKPKIDEQSNIQSRKKNCSCCQLQHVQRVRQKRPTWRSY